MTFKPGGITDMAGAEAFLYQYVNYERSPDVKYTTENYNLQAFSGFLTALGNPQEQFDSIHIAGTKGKGSVAAILSSVLTAHGWRTGLYTSPHLVTIRERIRINGQAIPEPVFIDMVNSLRGSLQRSPPRPGGYRTTFELLTALGFLAFARQGVRMAVLETGMGGRLDCTNTVTPKITAITPVSLDHMESLGGRVSEIAMEKAGIIKPGIPVVVADQYPEVMEVIRTRAAHTLSPVILSARYIHADTVRWTPDGYLFDADIAGCTLKDLTCRLQGNFQLINMGTALGVLDQLIVSGQLAFNESALRQGLDHAQWPGRFQRLNWPDHDSRSPGPWVDGAHNPAAIRSVVQTITRIYGSDGRVILVFAAPQNKDIHGMLELLAPVVDHAVMTRYDNPRAADIQELVQVARNCGMTCTPAPDSRTALDTAKKLARACLPILVTGSLYLAGEIFGILDQENTVLAIHGTPGSAILSGWDDRKEQPRINHDEF